MPRRIRPMPVRFTYGSSDVGNSSNAQMTNAPTWLTEANLTVSPDDFMNQEQAEKVERFKACQSLFHQLDTSGKGLDEEQFLQFCREGLGDHQSEDHIRDMFMQIDGDTSGHITWDELSAMFLTFRDRASDSYDTRPRVFFADRDAAINEPPSRDKRRPDSPLPLDRHEDMVSCLQVNRNTYYYSASFDGSVKAWNCYDCSLHHIIQKTDVPVSTIRLFEDHKHLAVATIDRQINVYEVVWYGHELVRRFIGTQMNETLHPREKTAKHTSAAAGKAHILRTTDMRNGTVALPTAYKATKPSVPVVRMKDLVDSPSSLEHFTSGGQSHLVVGLNTGVLQLYNITKLPLASKVTDIQATRKMNIHRQLISQLIWCDQIGLVSSSWDTNLVISDVEHGAVIRMLGEGDGHRKSILSMDWSDQLKVLASAGYEREVFVWNPYILHPVTKLQGHHAPVNFVAFNQDDMQLITLDRDKTFKIWDLRGNKVFQTIKDLSHYYPEDCLSAMTYDPYRRSIVAAATYVRTWPLLQSVKGRKDVRQAARILPGIYNPKYNHLCTFERDTVNVWHVASGKKFFSFKARDEEWSDERAEYALSAAQFDTRGRKLIVSFAGGEVICFNYMNGEVVKKLERAFTEELSVLLHTERPAQNIKCTLGSINEELVQWSDDEGFFQRCLRKINNRGGTVSAMAGVSPNHVALGSSTGVIILRDLLHNLDEYELVPGALPKKLIRWGHSDGGMPQPRQMTAIAEDDWLEEEDEEEDVLANVIGQREPPSHVVEAIVYMETKEVMVSTMGDKFLHFWAVGNGVHTLCTYPLDLYRKERLFCLATDQANKWFLAADDEGYVFAWDVRKMPKSPDRFQDTYFRLFSHFKAHNSSIVNLSFVETSGHIVTSGASSDVKLHSMEGHLIGTFTDGQPGWDLQITSTWERPSRLPDSRMLSSQGPASPGGRDAAYFGDFLHMPSSMSTDSLPMLATVPPRSKRPFIRVESAPDAELNTSSSSLPPLRGSAPPSMRPDNSAAQLSLSYPSAETPLSTHSHQLGLKGTKRCNILKSNSQATFVLDTPTVQPGKDERPFSNTSINAQSTTKASISQQQKPVQDILSAMGGQHARKGAKSEWLGRIMNRWLEKEERYEGRHPLFNVVKATMGVTQATSAAFGDDHPAEHPEDGDEIVELQASYTASSLDNTLPVDASVDLPSPTSIKEVHPPADAPPRPASYIRQAVNEAKQADRQWADRAISLLPLQPVGQPTPLQTSSWLFPDTEAALRHATSTIPQVEVEPRNSIATTPSPRKSRSTLGTAATLR